MAKNCFNNRLLDSYLVFLYKSEKNALIDLCNNLRGLNKSCETEEIQKAQEAQETRENIIIGGVWGWDARFWDWGTRFWVSGTKFLA